MASPFDSSNEDRTEAPSTFRREEARRQGTVALSRDLVSIILLCAVGGAIYFAAGTVLTQFEGMAHQYFHFSHIDSMEKAQLLELRFSAFKSWAWIVLPVFATALIVGLITCAAQVGFYVTWEPLVPNWERMDPIKGFQRLFSGQGAMEAAKAIFKLVIAGFVIWNVLRGQAPSAGMLIQKTVGESTILALGLVAKMFFTLVLSLAVLGVADYAFQWYRVEQGMKMTRREAKDEYKLREGDPLIKSRIRQLQRRMASRRMMEAIPKADVIVTNPTHLAVALKYDADTMAAPKVTAKGADLVAKKIRELAQKHGVPLVENKPLARTLYKEIEIGHSVPRELYKAVAEVLAYVYRLRGMGRAASA